MQLPDIDKRKILSHATSVGNKRKQTEDRKTFVISNIVSIVLYPPKKADQNEVHAIKDLLKYSMSSAYRRTKGFYKMWKFDCPSQLYRGEMVYRTMHCTNKKTYQGIETEIS